MKFIISETAPCWVTWCREVEANTQEEALKQYHEDGGEILGNPEIGESLDCYDSELEIKPA